MTEEQSDFRRKRTEERSDFRRKKSITAYASNGGLEKP